MIDPKKLDGLLEELYAIEPAMRAEDASLRRLAMELLASKPDAPIDEQFVARLRSQILTRSVSPKLTFMSIFSSKNARVLVPGLAVVVLAVIGAVAFKAPKSGAPSSSQLAMNVERVKAGAFGSLAATTAAPVETSKAAPMAASGAPSATSDAAARSGASFNAAAPMMAQSGGSAIAGKAVIMRPIDWTPTIYTYSYKGDVIENLASQVDVYKRVTGDLPAGPLVSLSGLNLGLVDLTKAKDAGVQSFTIAEKGDNGYVFTVDPQQGMISINQNVKWMMPMAQPERLQQGDMLSNDDAISAASAFLDAYGISKDAYGAPVVNDQWHVQYMGMAAADRPNFWFPESVSVIYPTLIDGKIAYDQSGQPSGMNVNVDVRTKRVTGVWNLATRNYQVSSYAGETDAKRLIGLAESTDNYGGGYPENAKKVELDLGTPTIAYVQTWLQQGDQGAEVYAPALVFPITNAPADYWRKSVVIPLAKELLDAQNAVPTPVPMMEGGVAPGVMPMRK